MNKKTKVDWVYHSKNNKELHEAYTAWSSDYNKNMLQDYGWLAPEYVAKIMSEKLPLNSYILDAGCGTGLVGAALHQYGFKHLVGIDFCEAMLEEAKKSNAYQALYPMLLGNPLDFEDKLFDAIVAVGVFTQGHVGPEGLDELKRVLKQEGVLILGIRPDIYQQPDFIAHLTQLGFRAQYQSPIFKPMPYGEPQVDYQVIMHSINR